jgi:hypothetical protein
MWVDLCDGQGGWDAARFAEESSAVAAEHLRSHPQPVLARFCLSRFAHDDRPGQRVLAVRHIYRELRELSGDQDGYALCTIDEALGSVSMYRLWFAARRCSHPACSHGETGSEAGSGALLRTQRQLAP